MEDNTLISRFKRAVNAFQNKNESPYSNKGQSSSYRPDRFRLNRGNERSIVNSILNRIAVDASSIEIIHARTDEDDRYQETIIETTADG